MREWLIVAVLFLACGCGGRSVAGGDAGAEGGTPPDGAVTHPEAGPVDGASDVPVSGIEHQFVIDEIYVPESSQQAKDYAFDLDHNGTLDNQYGNILAALRSSMGSTSPQAVMDAAMRQGQANLC